MLSSIVVVALFPFFFFFTFPEFFFPVWFVGFPQPIYVYYLSFEASPLFSFVSG